MENKKISLAERARKLKEFSTLMRDREKIETEKVLEQPLTIVDFDIVSKFNDGTSFAVVVFEEYPDNFLFAGAVLTELLIDLSASYESEGINLKEVLNSEQFKIKLTTRKARSSGRKYTDVEILDN